VSPTNRPKGEEHRSAQHEGMPVSAPASPAVKHVLVVGASRGIGLEFVRQYLAAGVKVTATARSEAALDTLRALGAHALSLDVTRLDSTAGLAWQVDGAGFDVAIVNAGVYGPHTDALQTPTEAEFDQVMHTNVLGAMRVVPQIVDALASGARVAMLSSRMGSIGERTSGNGWLYRASKAAVNSVMKDTALTLGTRAICVSFHPGWVRTDMGGAGADLDVSRSVSDMRRVLEGLTPADSGRFLNHDGTGIDW
jgi:NAD(P)-dependent dehydrogenase (short-subunit alcohol dehydrogenase family)